VRSARAQSGATKLLRFHQASGNWATSQEGSGPKERINRSQERGRAAEEMTEQARESFEPGSDSPLG
jgi:hypothetical protein